MVLNVRKLKSLLLLLWIEVSGAMKPNPNGPILCTCMLIKEVSSERRMSFSAPQPIVVDVEPYHECFRCFNLSS